MSESNAVRGYAVVVQPGSGPSYWQPVPANGHADPALHPAVTRFEGLSMGYQTIAPGGRIREHSHGDQVELQICFRGRGRVVVDGATRAPRPAGCHGHLRARFRSVAGTAPRTRAAGGRLNRWALGRLDSRRR